VKVISALMLQGLFAEMLTDGLHVTVNDAPDCTVLIDPELTTVRLSPLPVITIPSLRPLEADPVGGL